MNKNSETTDTREQQLKLKAELRDQMRRRRHQLTGAERTAAGERIAERLIAWPELPATGIVATFLSLPDEIPTDAINRELRKAGYQLVVPVFSREAKGYRFAEWRPGEELRVGPMKVLEPVEKRYVHHTSVDLVVVPGLVYDRSGGRIGFGGGHYDRMLADCRADALFTAIGYPFQVVDEVPQFERDIRIDWILTPDFLIETSKP